MNIIINKLNEIGVDIEHVLRRIGGTKEFYLLLCRKFLLDNNYQFFMEALKDSDYQKAEIHIHTLKGVAANLGFVRLEHCCNILLTQFRYNNYSFEDAFIKNLTEEYEKIIEILNLIRDEK